MPISATCPKCGRTYSVKDEHAGKKFRCQGCQEAVTVPMPQAQDDWETDDFGDFDDAGYDDYEDGGDYDDYESDRPAPVRRRSPKKKKPAAKAKRPKKRSSSGSGSGAAVGKILGGVFVGLIAMGIVIRVINAGLDFGGSWQSYTTPDGNITVQMPGKVKSVPVKQMAPGGQSFGSERRSFMCVIVIEPMPAELNGLSENEMFDAMELGMGFLGATNVQRSTLKGRPCVTFDQSLEMGVKSSALAFVHKNKVYTLTYAYKGSKGNNQSKFFDSVQFN